MKKIIAGLSLALTLTLGLGATVINAQGSSFKDVSETKHEWAIESIEFMNKKGIITGYADGTFKPDQGITKAEFVSMYAKLFDKYKPNKTGDKFWHLKGYKDVPSKSWAFRYIDDVIYRASYLTYTFTNDGSQIFYPNSKLTRIGAVNLLPGIYEEASDVEAMKLTLQELKDVKVLENVDSGDYMGDGRYSESKDATNSIYPILFTDDYYEDDYSGILGTRLASLLQLGVMTANESYFNPKAPFTRAEAATTLYRLYENLKQSGELSKYSTK